MAVKREANISELLSKVDSDPHAAAALLTLAADYLEAGESVPEKLADYLARAFRRAASTPQPKDGKRIEDERIVRLAFGLGMTREAGRPRAPVPKDDVALAVAVFGKDVSQTKLSKAVRDASKGTEYEIGLSTARTRIQEAKTELEDAREKTHEIMESNEFKRLVRRR